MHCTVSNATHRTIQLQKRFCIECPICKTARESIVFGWVPDRMASWRWGRRYGSQGSSLAWRFIVCSSSGQRCFRLSSLSSFSLLSNTRTNTKGTKIAGGETLRWGVEVSLRIRDERREYAYGSPVWTRPSLWWTPEGLLGSCLHAVWYPLYHFTCCNMTAESQNSETRRSGHC